MEKIASIFECLLGSATQIRVVEETFVEFSCDTQGKIRLALDASKLLGCLKSLGSVSFRLRVHLVEQDSPHTLIDLSKSAAEEFLYAIREGISDDEQASVYLHFDKPISQVVEVYYPHSFFKWLNELEIPELLERFDAILGDRSNVLFLNPSFSPTQYTACFSFCDSVDSLPSQLSIASRGELVLARRENVTSDWNTLKLFPDDFRWLTNFGVSSINGCFARLENFLGVVSLANSTLLSSNGFAVRINGHVTRDESIQWSQIPGVPDIAIRDLFQWCYRASGSGPLSDKLGLLRNYMSLYWTESIFAQDLNVVAAVKAGFGMYLKRNLKEFVELRAKVASFILELDAKVTKAVETTAGNLEKNLYGVVTFVTSVVLIKALQDKTFVGAFSPEVALLGWMLIAISALHAFFAWKSVNKEMDRADDLYSDLKNLYSAFFTPADFDSIFSSEVKNPKTGIVETTTPLKKAKKYVRQRVSLVMWIWGATLAVIFLLICYLKSVPSNKEGEPEKNPAAQQPLHKMKAKNIKPNAGGAGK